MGLPQDKLGVLAGLDEGTASARISRYESGIHEPNIAFAERLGTVLGVPMAYFYASDDGLAALILCFDKLGMDSRQTLLTFAQQISPSV